MSIFVFDVLFVNFWIRTSYTCTCNVGKNQRQVLVFCGDIYAAMDVLVVSLQVQTPQFLIATDTVTQKTITGLIVPASLQEDFLAVFQGITPKSMSKKVKGTQKSKGKPTTILETDLAVTSSDDDSNAEPFAKKHK